jgi:hypothetical protein
VIGNVATMLLLAATLCSCIASNVVAPDQRLVVSDPQQLQFEPATAASLDGYFESVDLRGDAAVALRKIFYVFLPGGTYTGAALAEADGAWSFQTLNGTWSLTPAGLVLDGDPPVRCEAAPGHLRITANSDPNTGLNNGPNNHGIVVLRRGPLP